MSIMTSENEDKFMKQKEDEAIGDGQDHLDMSLC